MNPRTQALDHDLSSQPLSSTHASGAAGANQCPLDLQSLLDRCLGDRAFCGMMLRKFFDRAAHQLAALDRAANARNTIELTREAHTLKGIAANISAEALQTCAGRLEQAARTGELDKAAVLVQQVHAQVDRCLRAMSAVLAQVDAGA